jgi:hypothetical protein
MERDDFTDFVLVLPWIRKQFRIEVALRSRVMSEKRRLLVSGLFWCDNNRAAHGTVLHRVEKARIQYKPHTLYVKL